MTYGIYLPFAKLQALINGDLSGAIIHPFFIHLANLAGAHFWQERAGGYCLLHLQAGYLQSTLDSFATMEEDTDPLSIAQACWSMMMLYGMVQRPKALRQLKRCMEILQRNNIRFVPLPSDHEDPNIPSPCSPPEFTEYVHERAAFLAQIVYAEAFLYLIGQSDDENSHLSTRVGSYLEYCKTEFLYSEVYSVDGKLEEMSLTEQFRYHLPVCLPTAHSELLMCLIRKYIPYYSKYARSC